MFPSHPVVPHTLIHGTARGDAVQDLLHPRGRIKAKLGGALPPARQGRGRGQGREGSEVWRHAPTSKTGEGKGSR